MTEGLRRALDGQNVARSQINVFARIDEQRLNGRPRRAVAARHGHEGFVDWRAIAAGRGDDVHDAIAAERQRNARTIGDFAGDRDGVGDVASHVNHDLRFNRLAAKPLNDGRLDFLLIAASDLDAAGVGHGDRTVAPDDLVRNRGGSRSRAHPIRPGRREQSAGSGLPNRDLNRVADSDRLGGGRPIIAEVAPQRRRRAAGEHVERIFVDLDKREARLRHRHARRHALHNVLARRTCPGKNRAPRQLQSESERKAEPQRGNECNRQSRSKYAPAGANY